MEHTRLFTKAASSPTRANLVEDSSRMANPHRTENEKEYGTKRKQPDEDMGPAKRRRKECNTSEANAASHDAQPVRYSEAEGITPFEAGKVAFFSLFSSCSCCAR
jgi:hypothetical protein